jgi:hypothetical protein
VPLQDELRDLFAQVGAHAFDDPDTFRGAFDDFVPEGAATTGELRLLVDAIATGAYQRLTSQLELGADPATAIEAEAQRLARDRGTVETDGARWALSTLAYARGLAEAGVVSTRPSVPGPPPEPEHPAAPEAFAPTLVPHARAVAGTRAIPGEPSLDRPRSGRNRVLVLVAVVVTLVVAGVVAVVLLRDGDTSAADDEPGRTGAGLPAAPADLPDLPPGFPETFEFEVRLPPRLAATVEESFGEGVATEVYAGGDPLSPEVQADSGPGATEARVSELVDSGIPVRVKYYALSQVGQGRGDTSGQDLQNVMEDDELMAAYWTNVRDLLGALDGAGAPVELVAEPDLPGSLLSSVPDATSLPVSVAATGVEGLAGLPDTFAGWAQAWLALRDELAPDVRIGLTVSPWQVGDDFLPDLPTTAQVETWAAAFGESYATLGARFDFLDNIMTYAEAGTLGPRYLADDQFFERLLTWVGDISSATDTRVVLDNVPVGNSVYRTIDDSDYHYRDAWVEWILGADDFAHLVALRDAGVIGIVFGVDVDLPSMTCPCDAAGDGVTNAGSKGEESTSADDDGGYLAERLEAYAATGGLPL